MCRSLTFSALAHPCNCSRSCAPSRRTRAPPSLVGQAVKSDILDETIEPQPGGQLISEDPPAPPCHDACPTCPAPFRRPS
eukprot:6406988-Alexandrium_andersonii.AAC.1